MRKSTYWTIQVLPEGSGRSHSYRVSKRAVGLGTLVLCGLVALSCSLLLVMLGRGDVRERLARYELENEQLLTSLRAMEQRSDRLGQALDGLAEREQRFRVAAGLPLLDPDVYSVGIGGPGGTPAAADAFFDVAPELAQAAGDVTLDLEQLMRRAELLAASLDEAADSVENHREQFLRIPSIWPVVDEDSWLSSPFSYNRLHPLLGYRRPHPGVDISAHLGSPVVAAGAGRVVEAGSNAGYGRLVEIEHGDGYTSRYAHLGRIAVRVGQRVSRGDVIGEVGRSGLTTGPNLHYEIRIEDRPVNPYNYLLDRYRR